jgi:hypothetical protein
MDQDEILGQQSHSQLNASTERDARYVRSVLIESRSLEMPHTVPVQYRGNIVNPSYQTSNYSEALEFESLI